MRWKIRTSDVSGRRSVDFEQLARGEMVTVPRPITGSIGSRVRVVLGKDGDEWLLLLNYDKWGFSVASEKLEKHTKQRC